ncbi:succinate semialdehyde dehydrogenase [Legionella quinlivanii]|uniref:Succinate semialdehyde dehydrogenase n=1 Tax=Legionella quinlivanii TaxID=45073 RepID=A0A0W0Y4F7_9GAMM|nr:NAD-dependent succinate-semialdehyde dehydrogenase [Legionella quinlivanii]KTD51685.1 succinate semialdehyde dehydrogenase [Legionella quinlivanii]SEF63011.1 succinate-semialdehyde dehydrogenase / glutarate-semialdehyde dehydrogenase [Legionella quinlivanii DSM 21216]STY10788.1 succinate semialdehyde dehydrogenase [Legionella quinlivanii]
MIFQTINPANEHLINEYKALDYRTAETRIHHAYTAFKHWKSKTFAEKSTLVLALAKLLRQKSEELAQIITMEMGKPITQSQAEIEKCAWVCEHYAANAEHYLADHSIQTEMKKTFVCYRPLGVILAIMPWNFPFWQVFRCAIPAIMAGNAVLLKHAPISIGAGNAMEQLFLEAGFPNHLFQNLIIDNDVAAKVIAHPEVAGLSFTGSEKAGRIVGGLAVSNLKKAVLELGGSDPYLILEDADLDIAAQAVVSSRLNNCGQVCIAAKRVIAVHSIKETLLQKIEQLIAAYKMDDPAKNTTKLGPLARNDLRETLQKQVDQSLTRGCRLITGGTIPQREGFYYPATLLVDVKPGMPAFDEELFGPVIALIDAKDEEQGIELANHSSYGLGAAVFTRDISRGERIARDKMDAGSCFVNTFVASDPRVPFGGTKHSGLGRELSREGILEFVNVKTVAIK